MKKQDWQNVLYVLDTIWVNFLMLIGILVIAGLVYIALYAGYLFFSLVVFIPLKFILNLI